VKVRDPLFEDAPASGAEVAFEWRRAQGSVCAGCGRRITGRRFEHQHLDLVGSGPVPGWFHGECFDWELMSERWAAFDRVRAENAVTLVRVRL
jgi:hypothetical protein